MSCLIVTILSKEKHDSPKGTRGRALLYFMPVKLILKDIKDITHIYLKSKEVSGVL